MSKSCVICGDPESEGELLLTAPCGQHFVCIGDLASFFENATQNESLFPPKCCEQIFLVADYEDYIPFETLWAYQMKEQGEYATLAKYRVYCGNPSCSEFLHPTTHIKDSLTDITYAICENEDCGRLTCCSCKTLLEHGTQNHTCHQDENEKKFKETATKEGYQECFVCGTTVELAEACNHITCECGHQFCYICGKDWSGLHGCPHYGPAEYDADGYNQDGFHRDTGLNREGLTRHQEFARQRGEGEPDDDDDGDEEEDPDWEVLQHIDVTQRVVINQLPQHEREDALDNLRIQLFETQGIIFGQGQDQDGENEGENPEHSEDEGNNPEDSEDESGSSDNSEDDAIETADFNDEDEDTADPHDGDEGTANNNHPIAVQGAIEFGNPQLVRLRAAFIEALQERVGEPQHDETGEDHASPSSASDDARPLTPMDIDDPPLTEESKETDH